MTVYVLVFLAVFAYVSWRNLRVGLYLILMFVPTYLLRLNVLGVPTTVLELMIYVAALIWLWRWWRRHIRLELGGLRAYIWPLAALGAGLAIGVWVAPDWMSALGIIKGWFFDPLLLAWLMVTTLSQVLHIKKSIAALCLSGLFLSAVAIWRVVSSHTLTIDGRASAFLDSANYLALYLVPIIVLGVVLLILVPARWRWWVGGSLVVMLGALYLTLSYAGWLALALGLVVLGLVVLRSAWPIIAGVAVLGLVGLSQWQHPKFQQMLDLVGRSSSHVRIQTWQTSWLMIREHALTGIGLGAFESRYSEFATRLFSPPLESSVLHPHNVLLHFLTNTGVVGLLGWVGVVGIFARDAWAALHHHRLLAAGLLAAMSALLAHGLLDGAYFKNDLAVVFWVLVAFAIILSRLSNTSRT